MDFKRILLVEDSINDVELILTSLVENHLGNEVVVVRDGAEAFLLPLSPWRLSTPPRG